MKVPSITLVRAVRDLHLQSPRQDEVTLYSSSKFSANWFETCSGLRFPSFVAERPRVPPTGSVNFTRYWGSRSIFQGNRRRLATARRFLIESPTDGNRHPACHNGIQTSCQLSDHHRLLSLLLATSLRSLLQNRNTDPRISSN